MLSIKKALLLGTLAWSMNNAQAMDQNEPKTVSQSSPCLSCKKIIILSAATIAAIASSLWMIQEGSETDLLYQSQNIVPYAHTVIREEGQRIGLLLHDQYYNMFCSTETDIRSLEALWTTCLQKYSKDNKETLINFNPKNYDLLQEFSYLSNYVQTINNFDPEYYSAWSSSYDEPVAIIAKTHEQCLRMFKPLFNSIESPSSHEIYFAAAERIYQECFELTKPINEKYERLSMYALRSLNEGYTNISSRALEYSEQKPLFNAPLFIDWFNYLHRNENAVLVVQTFKNLSELPLTHENYNQFRTAMNNLVERLVSNLTQRLPLTDC